MSKKAIRKAFNMDVLKRKCAALTVMKLLLTNQTAAVKSQNKTIVRATKSRRLFVDIEIALLYLSFDITDSLA